MYNIVFENKNENQSKNLKRGFYFDGTDIVFVNPHNETIIIVTENDCDFFGDRFKYEQFDNLDHLVPFDGEIIISSNSNIESK